MNEGSLRRKAERATGIANTNKFLDECGLTNEEIRDLLTDPQSGRRLNGEECHPGQQYFNQHTILLARILQELLALKKVCGTKAPQQRRRARTDK